MVTPAPGDVLIPAPSDAQVLFDGKDLAQWCRKDGSPAAWTVENGDMVVKAKSGNIQTKRNFGDCQLHIEWCTPENVSDTGQLRSNSGVFLQSLYEVQILDSYLNDTYWNGQAGSIYKQYAPLVNATKAPGQWNVYDIIYTAPRFNADGSLLSAARITVLQNGVLVQNNTTIKGTTFLELPPTPHTAMLRSCCRTTAMPSASATSGSGNCSPRTGINVPRTRIIQTITPGRHLCNFSPR